MGDFIGGRRAHFAHRALENQPLARQRVVAVDHHLVLGDVGDGVDHPAVVVFAGRQPFELHADRDIGGEHAFRLDADQVLVVFAEGVLRVQREREVVADCLAGEAGFDQRENAVVAAVQVGHPGAGFVERVAVAVGDFKGESDDGVLGNVHGDSHGNGRKAAGGR